MIASFVFELDTYCVNGYAAHANGERRGEPRAAEAASDERQPEQREQVERSDVQWAAGSSSHFPLQPNSR